MSETLDFLTRHGPLVLFLAVFVEQMGVPLPAAPWLLAAGALAGAGKMNGVSVIAAATFGSLHGRDLVLSRTVYAIARTRGKKAKP